MTHMHLLKDRRFVSSLIMGFFLVTLSCVINAYAVTYATDSISNPVTDIVLSNTPVYNVDGFFVYGAVLLIFIITMVCLARLERAPFVLKSVALFTVIRSFFVSLTHISPFPQHTAITANFFTTWFPSAFTGADLFFSGHTGLPFLLALIFWDTLWLRTLFLGLSILFGAVVLLGHLHYTIDVVSAFFITFTIFTLAKSIFRKDWERIGSR